LGGSILAGADGDGSSRAQVKMLSAVKAAVERLLRALGGGAELGGGGQRGRGL
jgi:hypothetical protein